MHRAPPRQAHADGGDLARLVTVVVDPHPGVLGQATGHDAELGEYVDQQRLDRVDVLERTLGVGQRQDRVADELPGTVVGDVASAPDGDEVGADRLWVAAQVVRQVGVASVGEDVVVLEQQHVLLVSVFEQRLLDGERLAVRHTAEPADAKRGVGRRSVDGGAPVVHRGQSSADQSRVSRISLTRRRKFAA